MLAGLLLGCMVTYAFYRQRRLLYQLLLDDCRMGKGTTEATCWQASSWVHSCVPLYWQQCQLIY